MKHETKKLSLDKCTIRTLKVRSELRTGGYGNSLTCRTCPTGTGTYTCLCTHLCTIGCTVGGA